MDSWMQNGQEKNNFPGRFQPHAFAFSREVGDWRRPWRIWYDQALVRFYGDRFMPPQLCLLVYNPI